MLREDTHISYCKHCQVRITETGVVEVNLEFYQMFSNTDIAVKILTLIKLKVEAGQRQHYIVGVTLLSMSL